MLKLSKTALTISRIGERPITPALEGIAFEEGNHFTKKRVKDIAGTFIMLMITVFLMKNNFAEKQDLNTNLFIKVIAFMLFCSFCIWKTKINSQEIKDIHRIKRMEDYNFFEKDIHFDKNKILFLVISCFFAGMLSGILGIDGGIIMSPLFLSMNMEAQVVAATNQYIGMVSSLSVTLQNMYSGQLNYSYFAFTGIFILVSAVLGLTSVNNIVKKNGRSSIIIFTISFVLLASFIILPVKYAIQ